MDISMLEEALGEALYAQALEKLSEVEGLRVITTDDGTWLPKGRLDEEIAKRRELQETVGRLNAQLEACGGVMEEVEALRRELAELRRGETVRQTLREAGARDVGLVEKLVDAAGDIEAQVEALKENSPYLFEEEQKAARAGFGGGRSARLAHAHQDVNDAIRAAAGRNGY